MNNEKPNKETIPQSEKYTKVKIKWKEYYFGHQFKSIFHFKIRIRNHKFDKDGT